MFITVINATNEVFPSESYTSVGSFGKPVRYIGINTAKLMIVKIAKNFAANL